MKLTLLLILLSSHIVLGADFYVSTKGSDSATGTFERPFASLVRARDAVRELKQTQKKRDITIQIRGGEYNLKETIVFGTDDSGVNDHNIIYEAYPNETPIFNSDQKLSDWQPLSEALPHLPKAAKGKVWVTSTNRQFYTLYDRKQRLPRARSEGFQPIMPEDPKAQSKNQ